jgi:hypothetical protein
VRIGKRTAPETQPEKPIAARTNGALTARLWIVRDGPLAPPQRKYAISGHR